MLFVLLPRRVIFSQMEIHGNRYGKQFAGLCDCQARDFAINAPLADVNVAKVVIKEHYPTFSTENIKSLLYKAYIMNRFFVFSGFRTNVAKIERKAKPACALPRWSNVSEANKSINAKIVKELFNIADPVA